MQNAINTLVKALAQILSSHYRMFDSETSDLMMTLAAYLRKNTSE